MRVDPRRQRPHQDRCGDQRGPRAALHQRERPGQPWALQGGGEIAVGGREGTAEEALEHQRRGEGRQAVRRPGEQEGDAEPELGPQQQPLAAEPVGQATPERSAERAEDRRQDVEQPGPVAVPVAEAGQDRGEVRREAEGGERGDEVAGRDRAYLPAVESLPTVGDGVLEAWRGSGTHRRIPSRSR